MKRWALLMFACDDFPGAYDVTPKVISALIHALEWHLTSSFVLGGATSTWFYGSCVVCALLAIKIGNLTQKLCEFILR